MARKRFYTEDEVIIQPIPTSKNFKDLTGKTINNWYIIGYAGRANNQTRYWCQCSCGNITTVQQGTLANGTSTKCMPCKRSTYKEHYEWLLDIIKNPGDECIIWPYSLASGYGQTTYEGKNISASRLALILHTGINPKDSFCAHLPIVCHDRRCCNINHLRWATPKENSLDKALDRTNGIKLTENDILDIRNDNREISIIAKQYNCTVQTIYAVKKRKTWAWVK